MPRKRSEVLTVGEWMITLLVLAIPLLNLVMYILWAVSSDGDESRRNYCRAAIAWALIGTAIWLVFVFLIVGATAVSRT